MSGRLWCRYFCMSFWMFRGIPDTWEILDRRYKRESVIYRFYISLKYVLCGANYVISNSNISLSKHLIQFHDTSKSLRTLMLPTYNKQESQENNRLLSQAIYLVSREVILVEDNVSLMLLNDNSLKCLSIYLSDCLFWCLYCKWTEGNWNIYRSLFYVS